MINPEDLELPPWGSSYYDLPHSEWGPWPDGEYEEGAKTDIQISLDGRIYPLIYDFKTPERWVI